MTLPFMEKYFLRNAAQATLFHVLYISVELLLSRVQINFVLKLLFDTYNNRIKISNN